MSFAIVNGALQNSSLSPGEGDGATITFLGTVRNRNLGRPVEALEYEAYEALAVAEGNRIIEEAQARFAMSGISCEHSVGQLKIGDVAFRVQVVSPHRDTAFAACRYVVDEVKRRVPIWKREHYADGSTEWVMGSPPADSAGYYERQKRLPQIGEQGQAKLASARVLVVGAGGLGCAVLQYLAAAGVGKIGICDPDNLELSNLHRQTLYETCQVGRSKAELAAIRLRSLNPHIQVIEHRTRLTVDNAESLIDGYDWILDCGDNFELSFTLNDACVRLGKTLIAASIYQFEGHVFIVRPNGPCLRCLWEQMPTPDCVSNCADVGVLGVVPGVLGSLQASETIKDVLGLPTLDGELLMVGLLPNTMQTLRVPVSPSCPNCGSGEVQEFDWLVRGSLPSGAVVIDIREQEEANLAPLPVDSVRLPANDLGALAVGWDAEKSYVLVCERGVRSAVVARSLRSQGYDNIFSLAGGRSACAEPKS